MPIVKYCVWVFKMLKLAFLTWSIVSSLSVRYHNKLEGIQFVYIDHRVMLAWLITHVYNHMVKSGHALFNNWA